VNAKDMEPMVGRYIRVSVMGEDCRVISKRQGGDSLYASTPPEPTLTIPPSLCDEAVTGNFRVIAFDLPWHGKSYPPAGWEKQNTGSPRSCM
jgi:pimeloyl-ACP methyl ester carboxylesterase